MTKKDFLLHLENQRIDFKIMEKIEREYGFKIPDVIQKVVSMSVKPVFFSNGWRTLSASEILDASEDLYIDFKGQKILPVINTDGNDFIVYRAKDDTWSMFNVIDKCYFKIKRTFYDYF